MNDPVNIIGDIHGQYNDLVKLIKLGGSADNSKFLFLGDYVDRGEFSFEVVILVCCLKLNYPKNVFLLRGNHECREMTTRFNFRDEVLEKYDQEVYNLITDLFDCLPLAAIINNKFLALHGGISPELRKISDFNKVKRFREPPKAGLFCDILWSDPVDNSSGDLNQLYIPNRQRKCSYVFGAESLSKFLYKNNLLTIIRAHEVQLEGYKMLKWRGNDFPQVITIFSAADYCGKYKNKGAILSLDVC